MTAPIAGRSTPGNRPSCTSATTKTAPVLPAETKASASPSRTSWSPTNTEDSLRRIASRARVVAHLDRVGCVHHAQSGGRAAEPLDLRAQELLVTDECNLDALARGGDCALRRRRGREVAAHPVEGYSAHSASSASMSPASCASTAISRASPSRGGAPS